MTAELLDRPEAGHGHHEHGHDDHHKHRHRDVVVVIDNEDVPIHRGHYELAVLKKLGKVPESDDLLQLVETKLVKLPSDKRIAIEGCEIFVSCPQSGGSS